MKIFWLMEDVHTFTNSVKNHQMAACNYMQYFITFTNLPWTRFRILKFLTEMKYLPRFRI